MNRKRRRRNSEDDEDEESHVKVIGNKIVFYGDVNNKSCFDIIDALHTARKNLCSNQENEIFLHICSPGGDVYPALGLISQIENFPVNVTTVVEGCVASAGVLIALAGDKRLMTRNSYMLIHEIRSSYWGRYSECQDDLENQDLLMKDLKDYIVKKTNGKLKGTSLDNVLKRDLLWDSTKCISMNLADEII